MSLTSFLNRNGFREFEGYSQQVKSQVEDLISITNKPNLSVMEIGFNAGHSADIFLSNNSTLTLTSFDLGEHNYVLSAKKYIDTTYPNRHTLILGDSTSTVPTYIRDHPTQRFDVIFIDGGHDYTIAKADMENCAKLAHRDTIVILDDTMYIPKWTAEHTKGPTRIWEESLSSNTIKEIARKDYERGRGMSWGQYSL